MIRWRRISGRLWGHDQRTPFGEPAYHFLRRSMKVGARNAGISFCAVPTGTLALAKRLCTDGIMFGAQRGCVVSTWDDGTATETFPAWISMLVMM